MLVPLKDATHSKTMGVDTIHLFAIPPAVLTGIVLGARATSATEARLRHVLDKRRELRHVCVTRAILDLGARVVKIPWSDGGN
jgi:hypothetical protein